MYKDVCGSRVDVAAPVTCSSAWSSPTFYCDGTNHGGLYPVTTFCFLFSCRLLSSLLALSFIGHTRPATVQNRGFAGSTVGWVTDDRTHEASNVPTLTSRARISRSPCLAPAKQRADYSGDGFPNACCTTTASLRRPPCLSESRVASEQEVSPRSRHPAARLLRGRQTDH